MSKKKHHNKKSNKHNNDKQNVINDVIQEQTQEEEILDDEEDVLADEDNPREVDIRELNHIIDEIEDIKVYEERRTRRNNMIEKEKQSIGIDKRVILVIVSLILAVALFTTLIVDACCSGSSNKKSGPTDAKLKEVTNESVITLMNSYIEAIQKADIDALSEIVDNSDNISADKLAKESEYIEGYENIKLYYINGVNKGELVIFMSYDNKILNIKTPAPGAMMLYVIKKDDKYLVHTGVKDDKEVLEYIEKLGKNKNVIEFNDKVNKAFEDACKSDKNLAEFKAAITSTEEKQDKDEETTEAVEETTTKKKKK
ncbi:MAG: hypothetical protein E7270_04475 [Lachnospiraceae bacterium]|nr:hypothetical protein [Lachnospiraceae bacterium]